MKNEPPNGSTVLMTPDSCAMICCVRSAMRAAASVGSASVSSSEFVCSDCVPPNTAAIPSTVVRTMLLNGACSVRLAPDVWQCVRSMSDVCCFGEKFFCISVAQSTRAARSFAISM